MKRRAELPELLAPAGDMKCLYAAVRAGADAIYVGGRSFGARAYAKNFDLSELKDAVEYCHLHGVKLYVTVNTLIYDRELKELSDYVAELWHIGVDAVITADLGAIREIKRRTPNLAIHASTQMSVHNTDGANAAAELGCERVVLARELSRENIASVTEKSDIETEVFLHGALCVCHSGQCLLSSLVGGRSGNRGECAQPCRLPYSGGYPLSLADLSLADHINELIDSGVASLKIEGRMKSPDYVYTVTSIYRRLLNEQRCASNAERASLKRVFSRGEFTDGYFKGDKFNKMTGVRSERDKEESRAIEAIDASLERVRISASASIRRGEPSSLTLRLGDRIATAYGPIPTDAISSPLTDDGVKDRLAKMGTTAFSLDKKDIELTLDSGINLPPSAINALRRDAAALLASSEREPITTCFMPENLTRHVGDPLKTALFLKGSLYADLLRSGSFVTDSFDIVFLPLDSFHNEANGIYLPPVIFDSEMENAEHMIDKAIGMGARYALVGNIGHVSLAKRKGLIPIGDFRLNVTNSYSRATYSELGITDVILSPELTLPMARDIGGGEIVYGRIPLMITERCFIKENFTCKKCENASFKDRTGTSFPLIREFGHRNLLLNSRPTYMGDRKSELRGAGILHEHFIFSTEGSAETENTVSLYSRSEPLHTEVRRIGKR